MHRRPEADRERVIKAVTNGASIADACAMANVPRPTFDSWRARDADFRERVDRARDEPVDEEPEPDEPGPVKFTPPSRDQLLILLTRAAVKGNVRATELLLRETQPEPPPSRLVALVERMWAQ
jgi:hypothetical protein